MENNTPAQLKQDLEAIADLLKPHLQQDDRILAHKTQMAETETFITSVTLEWIASKVGFASQLPLFQPH